MTQNVPRMKKVTCWANIVMLLLVVLLIFPGPKKKEAELKQEDEPLVVEEADVEIE